jgi:hypothetical protein
MTRRAGQARIGTGEIYFRGGFTGRKYRATIEVDFRWAQGEDGLYNYWIRVPLLSTTAPLSDANCYLADWIPYSL